MLTFFEALKRVVLDDELCGVIYVSQWLLKNKHLRLICRCHFFAGVAYLCLFLHYAITQWKNTLSLDFLVAVLCLEVIVTSSVACPLMNDYFIGNFI